MADISFREIPTEQPEKELVSLKAKPTYTPKEVKLDKVELSKDIQRFDQRPRKVFVKDPYSYSSVVKSIQGSQTSK